MRYPEGRILIFTKAPQPGRVKTRLVPALGSRGAARLQARLINRTVRMALESGITLVQLWVADDAGHPFLDSFRTGLRNAIHLQKGDDLGARMAHAAMHALREAAFIVLIGTDCPAMDSGYLNGACAMLADGVDAVLGPAEDGGYVLIGLRRSDARLFSDIEWGTARVLDQTRDRLAKLNWEYRELPLQWDVDRPADLHRLRQLEVGPLPE